MRTTLDIEDDILFAAKEIARRAFTQGSALPSGAPLPSQASERLSAYGMRPLPARGTLVTDELIYRLRDKEGT